MNQEKVKANVLRSNKIYSAAIVARFKIAGHLIRSYDPSIFEKYSKRFKHKIIYHLWT